MLRESGLEISDKAVDEGLLQVRWPARFECLQKKPPVIYDGGHNPEGVAACMESVKACFGDQKAIMLCGVMEDKEYGEMLDILSPRCETALTVTPDNPRALSAEKLCEAFLSRGIPSRPFASMDEALLCGLRLAKEQEKPLLVLGSLYMYAEFRASYDRLA